MLFILHILACGAADRALLTVPMTFAGVAANVAPAAGVTVTLTEASVTLTDIRMESPSQTALRLPFISAAYAHPGHDFAGDVAGELTGTWTLDMLGEDALLGDACYEGDYATARVSVSPDPVTVLAGTATVDGRATPFRFEVAPDQEITGLSFEIAMSADSPPGGLVLSADLAHALSFVDWRTADTDGDATLTTADGALANTVLFGVVATPTWNLTLEPS
jgi:hypothetical protein